LGQKRLIRHGLNAPLQHKSIAEVWEPTHRHAKGGEYRLLMHAVLETDRSAAIVYDDSEGTVWVRPASEFFDGRFTLIEGVDF